MYLKNVIYLDFRFFLPVSEPKSESRSKTADLSKALRISVEMRENTSWPNSEFWRCNSAESFGFCCKLAESETRMRSKLAEFRMKTCKLADTRILQSIRIRMSIRVSHKLAEWHVQVGRIPTKICNLAERIRAKLAESFGYLCKLAEC